MTEVTNNPNGKTIRIGCIGCPKILALLSIVLFILE
jgi:hypothetical protein